MNPGRAVPLAVAPILLLAQVVHAQRGAGSARPGIDVLHYTFAVGFPPAALPETVTVRSTLLVRRTSADSLVLDLADAMRVSAVRLNGVTTRYGRDSGAVRLGLPAGGNDSIRVEVDARGRPRDGLIVRRDSAGYWTAFADHFPNRAREWLPTVDHPSDKATVEWVVRTPPSHRVIANGQLVEETPEVDARGTVTARLTRWRSVRPLYTAVMVIGVAPFATWELGNTACSLAELPGCVAQSVWITPDVRSYMPGPFARAGEMVALFARLAGPFPYEKLAHVQSSTRYGGMENASAIFYADRLYRSRAMGEGLIAHEIAHQWFGDAVTVREWPHVWLSEGFATYFAALWSESSRGDSALRDDLRRMRESVLRDPLVASTPVVNPRLDDVANVLNGLVYQKAGFVLHMLRREVGDSAFFRGVRAYYAKYRHGNAVTGDFRREMETAAGRDLDWFFGQWLDRPGYADLTVSWTWNARQRAVSLTISQNERFQPYRLSLPVEVTLASGRVRTIRVALPAARVATLNVSLPGEAAAPRRLAFDPDSSLLGTIDVRR